LVITATGDVTCQNMHGIFRANVWYSAITFNCIVLYCTVFRRFYTTIKFYEKNLALLAGFRIILTDNSEGGILFGPPCLLFPTAALYSVSTRRSIPGKELRACTGISDMKCKYSLQGGPKS